ncbi:MAG TPA: hypothetical protein VK249_00930 [Anaerolineales bacterium]|nr:hypothetical protein [Anaerolineales bacterium]
MNYFIFSNSFKRGLQIAVILLLCVAALGNSVAYAAGLCVHPTGAGKCFTSIQAAVDAAHDGDWIAIRPGRYIEQVTIIGKDLTLIGRSGVVIQAPAGMQDTLSLVAGVEGRPIILVSDANVTLRDLTIDGVNSAENNPFLEGVVFINADGVIRNNLVRNTGFGAPTLPIINGEPSYQGEGMLVVNFMPTPRSVTIAENRVMNYNSSGVTVFAQADPNDPTHANLTVHVVDNTVIGSGPNDVIAQWGIFFGGYDFADPQFSITGTLKGNRVRDQVTVAGYPIPGVGIATFSTSNVAMTDNVIDNVNIGLAAHQAFSARIQDNQFMGLGQAVSGSAGILLSGSNAQVLENRFKKLETGILLLVDDFAFGSALNTALDENRFDNVAVDVLTSPGASPSMAMANTTSLQPSSAWQRNRLFHQPLK